MNQEVEFSIRLIVAFIIGSLIGLEREKRHKPAGLRTHALVCLGSALFTIVGEYGFPIPASETIFRNADPARVAAQIVSGVGFIGAGIIFKDRGDIHGITTAASIWLTAALGMCVAVGFYLFAGVATVLAIVGLKYKSISERAKKKNNEVNYLSNQGGSGEG